ncbi:unnamed protein product [Lampetra planeri]
MAHRRRRGCSGKHTPASRSFLKPRRPSSLGSTIGEPAAEKKGMEPHGAAVPAEISRQPGVSAVPAEISRQPGVSAVPTEISGQSGVSAVPAEISRQSGDSAVSAEISRQTGASAAQPVHIASCWRSGARKLHQDHQWTSHLFNVDYPSSRNFQPLEATGQPSSGASSPTAEALRALLSALDDDALAAFLTIPPADRTTLQQGLRQMAAIYGPPSNVEHRFAARRQGEAETPFAFRSALLKLAKAAFPRMDHDGLDSLVLEKLLVLARDFHTIIQAVDDDDLCPLKVARCIQAHLLLQTEKGLVACTTPCDTPEETEPAQAYALAQGGGWRRDGMERRDDLQCQRRTSPRPGRGLTVCFNCNLMGHLSSGCLVPR